MKQPKINADELNNRAQEYQAKLDEHFKQFENNKRKEKWSGE